MDLCFEAEVWYWRGPSPFHFVTVPDPESSELRAIAREVTYGWGMIPVASRIGRTSWTTSLFPKDETYIVPIKTAVRRAESIAVGDVVTVTLGVTLARLATY